MDKNFLFGYLCEFPKGFLYAFYKAFQRMKDPHVDMYLDKISEKKNSNKWSVPGGKGAHKGNNLFWDMYHLT